MPDIQRHERLCGLPPGKCTRSKFLDTSRRQALSPVVQPVRYSDERTLSCTMMPPRVGLQRSDKATKSHRPRVCARAGVFLPLARADDRAILFATWNMRCRKVLRSRRAEDCSYFCPYRRQGTPPCTNGHEERARASGLRREDAEYSQKSEKSAKPADFGHALNGGL